MQDIDAIVQTIPCLSLRPTIRSRQIDNVYKFLHRLNYTWLQLHRDVLVSYFHETKYKQVIDHLISHNVIEVLKIDLLKESYSNSKTHPHCKSYRKIIEINQKTESDQSDPVVQTHYTGIFNIHMKQEISPMTESEMIYVSSAQIQIAQYIWFSNEFIKFDSSEKSVTTFLKQQLKALNLLYDGDRVDIPAMNNSTKYREILDGLASTTKPFKLKLGEQHCERIWTTHIGMPSVCRSLYQINGESLVACDFRAMAPNVILAESGYPSDTVTHKLLADYFKKPVEDVKLDHIKFFNQRNQTMDKSYIAKFYADKFPKAIEFASMIKSDDHKKMSEFLFKKEVIIMAEVCKLLQSNNIPGIYVYDCIYVQKSKVPQTKSLMMQAVKSLGYQNLVTD